MVTLTADLHLHSVLSPCGQLEMSPRAIVARAVELGLGIVGLSDHNCCLNAPALESAAAATGGLVKALYGLEVRSAEEVDVLTIFEDPDAAQAFGRWVWAALPDVPCDPLVFGDQVVVDADEEIVDFASKLLINGLAHSLEEVCAQAAEYGALVIPAHVDRPSDSVISQLGWLPPDLAVDAVEVSRFGDEHELVKTHRWLASLPVVRFSDAHRLADVGFQQTRFHVAEPTLAELRLALRGAEGRWAEPVRRALSKEV